MASELSVRCEDIRRPYHSPDETIWALWDVSMEAATGRLTVLAGPSGSGKSTLLRILAGIDQPVHGRVMIGDHDLTRMNERQRRRFRAHHIGFLFQDPAANLLSYLTVREHLQLTAKVRGAVANTSLLDRLEIGDLADERPAALSAGQQQRAALAAALIGNPQVILADEPTAELDTESARLAIDALDALRDLGATLVVTSHDAEVIGIADDVTRLERGMRVA
jgi:ABC-type lipoprotein export system ATPase subunit